MPEVAAAGWVLTAFWICLVVGAAYVVVALILGGITDMGGHIDSAGHVGGGDFSHDYGAGGDVSGHGEASSSAGAESGGMVFGPFSPLVIAFFLTCFGGAGVLLTRVFELRALLAIPIAFASAFVLAWLLMTIFNRFLGSLQSSSEVRLHTLIGTEADVTVDIPSTGVGEISYVAMGGRNVSPARSEDQVNIPRFSGVRISRIVGNMFYVRPLVEEQLSKLEDDPDAVGVTPNDGGQNA
ncbi:MAG: NfeD family protein [Armatimonadota bacterium]